mgnify:CR=1 FL=1|jgi:hypothetical protein|tara:strand:- start:146 stop:535 length:390 start_codon:yes stop_codon:yes gene_type:complete
MAEKIIYKNHCTPQEQADFATGNDRYYLDSDVGKKLTGVCESKASTTGSLVVGTFSSTITLNSTKFIYAKNTDTSESDYLLLNIGSMGAVIKLMPEESFASDVGSTASDSLTVVITASGTPGYEYIQGT